DKEGAVESVSDGVYTVLAGSLRFRLKRDELQLVRAAVPPVSKRAASLPSGVTVSIDVDQDFNAELNVIGTTVDEATDRVDKYLDDAFLAGVESVRIIHGHGKGALRKAIAGLLGGHPHVERFSEAPGNQGGSGATIVTLKK